MKTKRAICAACILSEVALTSPVSAEAWRELTVSCKVIRGGYDTWGMDADYSLMVRFANDRDGKPVTITMHELYNATLRISFQNAQTGESVKTKSTGDVTPRDLKDLDEAIVIGPGAAANIAIGLDGFETFRPGRYKGRHAFFKMEIPEFQIGKSGEVIKPSPEAKKTPNKAEKSAPRKASD